MAARRRAPAVSSTAVITIALGIGATLAVFATLLGVLLRPLLVRQSWRAVRLWDPFGLALTSVLACLGPALRAAAADPVVTLRK